MAPRNVRRLLALALLRAASATITNPSFEESGGWTSLSVFPLKIEDGEAWAPPHGTRFATLLGDATRISQTVSTIEAGATYELTVFARSVVPAGSSATTKIRAKLGSAEVSLSLDPVAPTPKLGNDDGGNVFFDGDFRLQASEHVMFQTKDQDPISDAWEVADEELPPIANYAPGPIHTPQGLRALYGTGGS